MSAIDALERALNPERRSPYDAWATLTDWDWLTKHVTAALLEVTQGGGAAAAKRWTVYAREWVRFWSPEQQNMFNSNPLAKSTAPSDERMAEFVARMAVACTLASECDVSKTPYDRAVVYRAMNAYTDEKQRAWGRVVLPGGIVGRVVVPVAFVSLGGPAPEGLLGLLELSLLDGGHGHVSRHPDCTASIASEFVDSMTNAWRSARGTIVAAATPPQPNVPELRDGTDGVWRLYDLAKGRSLECGGPMLEAKGTSAGGAAMRGWWHLLHGLAPDDGVVVCAEVRALPDGGYELCAVASEARTVDRRPSAGDGTWLRAKVTAIAGDPRFDRIVLVDDGIARRVVTQTLSELAKSLGVAPDVAWIT